jgi:hypothetical protein
MLGRHQNKNKIGCNLSCECLRVFLAMLYVHKYPPKGIKSCLFCQLSSTAIVALSICSNAFAPLSVVGECLYITSVHIKEEM